MVVFAFRLLPANVAATVPAKYLSSILGPFPLPSRQSHRDRQRARSAPPIRVGVGLRILLGLELRRLSAHDRGNVPAPHALLLRLRFGICSPSSGFEPVFVDECDSGLCRFHLQPPPVVVNARVVLSQPGDSFETSPRGFADPLHCFVFRQRHSGGSV